MDLKNIRKKIDNIDDEILLLLSARMALMESVVEYKAKNDISIFDAKREVEILQNKIQDADEKGLGEDFVRQLFQLIMNESKNVQDDIIKNSKVT